MINRVCKSNWTWRIPREESIPFGGPFYEAKIIFSIDNIIKIITHCQPKFQRLKKVNFVSCDQHFLFQRQSQRIISVIMASQRSLLKLSLLSFWISWCYHGGFFLYKKNKCWGYLIMVFLPLYHIKKPKLFPSDALKRLCYFSFLHFFYHCFIWPIFLLIWLKWWSQSSGHNQLIL